MTTVEQAAVEFLIAHGAKDVEHPGGSLLAHLRRTAATLREWGAPTPLAMAGLCHAAYGTDGFATSLIDVSQRATLAEVIGADADAIVYFYASCDRAQFYPSLGREDRPRFRDRFTRREYVPDRAIVRDFIELTIANELDVLSHAPEMLAAYGTSLAELFTRCRGLTSDAATAAAETFFYNHAPCRG